MRVGDPVYYKMPLSEGKLDQRWEPYYRILERTGPVSFVIWDQMAGRTKRANSNDLKLAEIADWEVSEPKTKRVRKRKVTLVEPEEMETDEDYGEEEDRVTRQQPVEAVHGDSDKTVEC